MRRLTHPVRDPRAGYDQTLRVLAHAKQHRAAVLTKSSLMLGLGETAAEIEETLADLRAAGVDIVTLGQYLRPTVNHLPVESYVTPAEFDRYRESALSLGFLSAFPDPWCAPAIALSRRSIETTQGWTTLVLRPRRGRLSTDPGNVGCGERCRAVRSTHLVRNLGLVDYEPTWQP